MKINTEGITKKQESMFMSALFESTEKQHKEAEQRKLHWHLKNLREKPGEIK